MATLPRPSRPSLNPPNAPLPALPVSKARKNSLNAPVGQTPSSPSRAVSSSALPTRLQPKSQGNSTSSLPTLSTTVTSDSVSGPPPGKTLRKTISIGSFPQPPRGAGRMTSHPPSPLSNSETPATSSSDTQRLSGGSKSIPKRHGSLGKAGQRVSGRVGSLKSPSASSSLLNGSCDYKSVSSTGLLSLPSPPASRNSSAQGSYATSVTTFEDTTEDEARAKDTAAADSKSETQLSGNPKDAKDGKGNVIVSVRVRPEFGGGHDASKDVWTIDGQQSLVSYKGREAGDYIYDNVFTTQDNNARVYDAAAKRLVRRVMEGYHGTVFAYGMTGTGKTFSMQGTATSPGVIPLAITDIFSFIRETPHREFLLRVSYLEIYNEKIYDLLAAPPGQGANGQTQQEEIKLREDSKRGVYAAPLKEEIVQSPTQLLRVIARGDQARRVAGTQYNARSSRSHAVVQIVVESRERVPGSGASQENKRSGLVPGGVRVSTLSLIDLAGSEKAAESKERRQEGAHINKSLLTLGTVIARLSGDKDKAGNVADKEKHLPYRDSKLTRLLQPALSGNSLVSILCTIQIGSTGSAAAAGNHTGETLNTLKFASRAKNNIVSHAKRAEESFGSGTDPGGRALLERYRAEIVELRKQLEHVSTSKEKAADEEEEKKKELAAQQRHEDQMLELQLARTALKERIEHLNRLILSSKSLGVNSNRSFSVLSYQHPRGSVFSNGEFRPMSARSSTTLDVPNRSSSGTISGVAGILPETGSEEEDSLGENGDGTATFLAQIRSLQADLADKNRYIQTLEKRLLQARRSSHSRISLQLQKSGGGDEGGVEAILREKDAEVADLRSRLDDKDKMIASLRSAARRREYADLAVDTTPPSEGRRVSSLHRSTDSNASSNLKPTPQISPVALLSPVTEKQVKGVEEMTKVLDEMIAERMHSVDGQRNSIGDKLSTGIPSKLLQRNGFRVASEGS